MQPRCGRRVYQWLINRRTRLIMVDYEVLGSASGVGHFFLRLRFSTWSMVPLGAFVGAACRSLTPAQRVRERSEWWSTGGADDEHRCLCWWASRERAFVRFTATSGKDGWLGDYSRCECVSLWCSRHAGTGRIPSVIHARFKHLDSMASRALAAACLEASRCRSTPWAASYLPFDRTFFRATCPLFRQSGDGVL